MTSDQAPGEKGTAGNAPADTTGQAGQTGQQAAPAEGSAKTEEKAAPTTAKAQKPAKPGPQGKPDRKDKSDKGEKAKAAAKAAPALIRTRVAQAVWLLCVLAALFLALGALVIALDFNQQNAAVEFVLNGAEQVDLGVFTRDEGIKQFSGENAETKNALVNYGVGALFWIVVGRLADRFIRP